ncbi:restriction endonuclease subunit S [Prevotella melaninogenica]|uniref:Restriction endonuclease subunit S n=1 Tax=Prevotella melaninogenica TaxID=28132 RepID=A0ABX7XSQ7_9BACT|nr:restriction endonuclease subunit S [Prevotella melaninogenica]QUB76625.1 restriction endonuclease subunit S [Prevotella melaninogenica]
MKYIDELLKGHEVVWKELGEVFSLVTDFTAAGSFASNAANVQYKQEKSFAQLVRTTDLKSKFKNTDKFVYVDEHAYEYLWRVNLNEECLVLSNVGNCGEVYYIIPEVLPYAHNVLGPNALLLRTTLGMNKFFYYWFLNSSFQNELGKITSNTGQTKFNKTNLKKILIPLPPLSVQEEIVRILDKFTTLEAELDCRKRQYEYYRNQLLSFDMLNRGGQRLNNINVKSLEEVVEIKRGRRLVRKELSGTGRYAVFQNSMTPLGYFDNSNVDGDSTFIISAGAAGEIGYSSVDFWAADDIYYFIPSTMVCSKYLYYFLLTKRSAIKGQVRRASVPRLAKSAFAKIQIPIPSLTEQHRIVSILDKFDTLVNSISEGLPKEIELRRKQYEYY